MPYEHCDISPQNIEAFFVTNHMDITEDQVFCDLEVLCNELAAGLSDEMDISPQNIEEFFLSNHMNITENKVSVEA